MSKLVKILSLVVLSFSSAIGGTFSYDHNGRYVGPGGGYDRYGRLNPAPPYPSHPYTAPNGEGARQPRELPASVITEGVPQTAKQKQACEKCAKQNEEGSHDQLVQAAGEGNLSRVKRICCSFPKEKGSDWDYIAACMAAEAGHNEVVSYLAHEQPVCSYRKKKGLDEICYDFFWRATMLGDRPLFDYFINHGIDINRISKVKWSLTSNGEVCYRNTHVNVISFLRAGYYVYGENENRKYMKEVLYSRGLTTTPSAHYSDGDDCCDVQ